MAYASFNDVIIRFPPLYTMIGSGVNEVATGDISSIYLYGAEGIVNGYVGAKYSVPIVMPEPLITQVTADIAIYKLCEDKLPRIPDYAEKRYQHSIEILQAINSGQMVLTGSGAVSAVGGNNEAWSNQQAYHPIFSTVLNELEQRADSDEVQAERDARLSDLP